MNKSEIDKIISRYQSANILWIFIISGIASLTIIFCLEPSKLPYTYLLNSVNLLFKVLSIMITIFVPVILIDAYHYSTIEKEELVQFNSRPNKIKLFGSLFGLYALLMFGNIRVWIMEIYKSQDTTSEFVIKIDWVETTFLFLFALAVIVVGSLMIYRKIVKSTKSKGNTRKKH